jgi:hypothetical protein
MTVEVDLKEMKDLLCMLNKKLDLLIENRETLSIMSFLEKSLKDFLGKEPDVYSMKDVKVRYSSAHWLVPKMTL